MGCGHSKGVQEDVQETHITEAQSADETRRESHKEAHTHEETGHRIFDESIKANPVTLAEQIKVALEQGKDNNFYIALEGLLQVDCVACFSADKEATAKGVGGPVPRPLTVFSILLEAVSSLKTIDISQPQKEVLCELAK
jgi:hypothetical protein